MKPVIVLPLHDPGGLVLPHLERITLDLKDLFSIAVLQLSLPTRLTYPERVAHLEAVGFYQVNTLPSDLPVGDQFKALYMRACASVNPPQVLHLCFPDRVAFALSGEHRQAFMSEMQRENMNSIPLLYQRSISAWSTHPRNLHSAERQITTLGEKLFGRSLDFAWCHLVINAGQLSAVLTQVHTHGPEMMAEMILPLRDMIHTHEVDWLAWEDPFILRREAGELKYERENCTQETQKRLSYVMPTMDVLNNWQDYQKL